MNTIDPAQPPHQDYFPLPEFLGCPPDEGPERLPEPPWIYLFFLIGEFEKRYPNNDPGPTDAQLKKFIQAWFTIPLASWEEALTMFLKDSKFWGSSPNLAWATLFFYLEPDPSPSQEKVKDLQDPWGKKKFTTSHPVRLLGEDSQDLWQTKKVPPLPPTQSVQEILTAIIFPPPEPHPTPIKKKSKPLEAPTKEKRFLDFYAHPILKNYILKEAPSPSYELIYSKIIKYCYNKFTRKGRKVYPYGQAFISKITHLSPRTIRYAWSWLRNRGILNKAWNENRDAHHCSGWYVCTSLKQVVYYRDPQNRHQKTSLFSVPFPPPPRYTNSRQRRTRHFKRR